ncbi:efflux transporter outer membrane subunit [Croceicoccus bisphenolivorans]|uniref:efflux transporter outer membrane subunit n=1 Tax=Croceicoccus bisphenolivorans TaxID=1783232 RepID=UPI000831CD3D|nr:efflux transporter outer membrane subunit [Croceicoccus bisphenolivorans]
MRFIPLILAAMLSGCATLDHADHAATDLNDLSPDVFHEDLMSGVVREDVSQWWLKLDDPVLTSLVERAFDDNLDLVAARARLRQAREAEIQARASLFPSISAGGTVSETTPVDGGGSRTSLSLEVDASYELDLFGGVRSSIDAARSSAEATAYELESTRVSLAAEIARTYVEARLAQRQYATSEDLLGFAEDNLQIADWRREAGLVSSLDVEQARGERAQTAAALPGYTASYKSAVHRLSVLIGETPGYLHNELDTPAPIPDTPATIAVGVPLDTLRQRPDVLAAERSLAAETDRIGVARAELYPRLNLGGSIGGNGVSVGDIVDALTVNVFASISQLIFDAGRTRSQVRSQEAVADVALANYRQTVLLALEDVENALVSLRTAQEREVLYSEALAAARNQAILTRVSYRSGLTDFTNLLNAERSLASAEDGLAQSHANASLAAIQLYRAMGGGWNAQENLGADPE